jgi:hypothetical protein
MCGGGIDCGYQWGTLVSVYPCAPPTAHPIALPNCFAWSQTLPRLL